MFCVTLMSTTLMLNIYIHGPAHPDLTYIYSDRTLLNHNTTTNSTLFGFDLIFTLQTLSPTYHPTQARNFTANLMIEQWCVILTNLMQLSQSILDNYHIVF